MEQNGLSCFILLVVQVLEVRYAPAQTLQARIGKLFFASSSVDASASVDAQTVGHGHDDRQGGILRWMLAPRSLQLLDEGHAVMYSTKIQRHGWISKGVKRGVVAKKSCSGLSFVCHDGKLNRSYLAPGGVCFEKFPD